VFNGVRDVAALGRHLAPDRRDLAAPFGGIDLMRFGLSQAGFGGVGLPGEHQRPGVEERKRGPGADRVIRQGAEPAQQGAPIAAGKHRPGGFFDQSSGKIDIASGQRMPHRLAHLTILHEPFAGPAMPGARLLRRRERAQNVREEVMIAIPTPFVV
jgi:hypothetical protein